MPPYENFDDFMNKLEQIVGQQYDGVYNEAKNNIPDFLNSKNKDLEASRLDQIEEFINQTLQDPDLPVADLGQITDLSRRVREFRYGRPQVENQEQNGQPHENDNVNQINQDRGISPRR